MGQPSQKIVDRYQLELSLAWRTWFDDQVDTVIPAGAFRTCLPVDDLIGTCPNSIWPGFMLPDTLPLVGNEYGDWVCVRITAQGELGELLHWYHGGGDWVPLGGGIAEALLHDVVDQFRPTSRQVLRGAAETIVADHCDSVLAGFGSQSLRDFFARHLAASDGDRRTVVTALDRIESLLRNHDYSRALQLLSDHQWAIDAVACDLIEDALQRPVTRMADPKIANALELNWTPDFARLLFDIDLIPAAMRPTIVQLARLESWPQQDWQVAQTLAEQVLARRHDLGWAFHIAGWSKQRAGDKQGAALDYFHARYASAFSDQSVRMRTHWIEPRFGKFALAQLATVAGQLEAIHQDDGYLATVWNSPEKLTIQTVQGFWLNRANQALADRQHGSAYEYFYRAGWDLGVQRISEYQPILEGMVQAALGAGWAGRAAVARTHLDCLLARWG